MIDVRWSQQHYARTAGWAGQRFPLLQRLLARTHGGETRPGGDEAGFVYRVARAFPVTLASTGADLPGTAAAPLNSRRQPRQDFSDKVDIAHLSPKESTANAGPLPDHLTQRATRPLGVINVQQSRQQASRAAGGLGQTLTLLKPLLARYDSGRGAETGSDSVRVAAASSTTRPASLHWGMDLSPSAAIGGSAATKPAAGPQHNRQIGRVRSFVTGTASETPGMAVLPTFSGRGDRPTSTALMSESSPPPVANLRVRRKALPAARTVVDPPLSDRIHAVLTPLAPDFSPTTDAGLRDPLPLAYRIPDLPSEEAASNRLAKPETEVAAKRPLATGQQTIAQDNVSNSLQTRASDGLATVFRQAAGAPIQKPGDNRLPVATPSPRRSVAADPVPIDEHPFDKTAPLAARPPVHVGTPAAAVARTAMDRPSSGKGESINTLLAPDFPATTDAGLRNRLPLAYRTPDLPPEEAASNRLARPETEVAARLPTDAGQPVTAIARTALDCPSSDKSEPVRDPLAPDFPVTTNAAEPSGDLPLAYPTAAQPAAAVNAATPDAAAERALPVIQEKATSAASNRDSAMVWRQRTANSPSPEASATGNVEPTRALTVAARPPYGSAPPAPSDGQPSLAAPTSDIPLPAATWDWDALVAQLSRRIHRQLTIERERRGVK